MAKRHVFCKKTKIGNKREFDLSKCSCYRLEKNFGGILKPYWRDENFWICPRHLPALKIPSHIQNCWFSGCSSKRPSPNETTTLKKGCKKNTRAQLCAWFQCNKGSNGTRAFARKNSKYCSRDCSNRNARWRHKNRDSD